MVKGNYTFPKVEKLKSKTLINMIFTQGHSVRSHPLRIQFIFHNLDSASPVQMGASVPKKLFKKAVDRNKLKRQIKEAYRLHKTPFIDKVIEKEKRIGLMIVYSNNQIFTYKEIQSAMIKALDGIRV